MGEVVSVRTVVIDLGYDTKVSDTPQPFYMTKWTLYYSVIYVSTVFTYTTQTSLLPTTVTVPTKVTVTADWVKTEVVTNTLTTVYTTTVIRPTTSVVTVPTTVTTYATVIVPTTMYETKVVGIKL